jgi:hypothetical protein
MALIERCLALCTWNLPIAIPEFFKRKNICCSSTKLVKTFFELFSIFKSNLPDFTFNFCLCCGLCG